VVPVAVPDEPTPPEDLPFPVDDSLASTGSDIVPFLLSALAAIALGVGILVLSRRRSH
jgi:LPXTG-motif cell wall-anchored protein